MVNKLAVPLSCNETFKKSFSYSGAVLLNSLPDHFKTGIVTDKYRIKYLLPQSPELGGF